MAESTRSNAFSDRLEDVIAKLTTHLLSPTETVHTMTMKLDELIHKLSHPRIPFHHLPRPMPLHLCPSQPLTA